MFKTNFFKISLIMLLCFVGFCAFAATPVPPFVYSPEGSVELSPAPTIDNTSAWKSFLSHHPGKWQVSLDGNGIAIYASVINGEMFPQITPYTIQFFLKNDAFLFGLNPNDNFSLKLLRKKTTKGNLIFVFQHYQGDLKVFQSTFVLKLNKRGQLRGFSNNLKTTCLAKLNNFSIDYAVNAFNAIQLGTITKNIDVVLYKKNNQCMKVLQSFVLLPMYGYKNPVEMLCLISQDGNILFKKALNVPFRQDAWDK